MSSDGHKKVLGSNEELLCYEDGLRAMTNAFCDAIATRNDFTIHVEIRGNKGHLVHFRLHPDTWLRPKGVERKIAAQGKQA